MPAFSKTRGPGRNSGIERTVIMKFDKGLMAGSGTMLVLSLMEGATCMAIR